VKLRSLALTIERLEGELTRSGDEVFDKCVGIGRRETLQALKCHTWESVTLVLSHAVALYFALCHGLANVWLNIVG
jgi:hypothetical protein